MSYSSDTYSGSSYRKIFGDAPRMYRSTAAHRSYGQAPGAVVYHRSAGKMFGAVADASLPLDPAQNVAITNEMKIIRTNEKEQLQGLNDRFATFIEKVRALEQQKRTLEAEVSALRQLHAEPSRVRGLYEREIRGLRTRLDELTREQGQARLEGERAFDALERAQDELREQTRRREEAENALRACRGDADEAAAARLGLERKVESLLGEIDFLRKVHDEELRELQASLQDTQVCVEMDMSKPDLAIALKDIRAQYEALSSRNQQQAEEWYHSKFANVTEAAARNDDAIKQAKDELSEYRRQLQSRSLEVEALRGHNEALERQLAEMEDHHSNEIGELQETIQQLENALRSTKGEMSRHLREYQDLLNVKMALDIEIAAYRKLLEGEECRMSSVGGAMLQSAYPGVSYTASRSYTLSAYRAGIIKSEEEEEEPEAEEKEEEEGGEEEEEQEGGEEEGGEEEGEEKEEGVEEGEEEGEKEEDGEGEEEEGEAEAGEGGEEEGGEGEEQEEGEGEVENGEEEKEVKEEEKKEVKEEKGEKEGKKETKEKVEDKPTEKEKEAEKKKIENKEENSKSESKNEKSDSSKAEKVSAAKTK